MFRNEVFKAVKAIPEGMVSTYGFVASAIGKPRAARQVGQALRSLTTLEEEVPWWRVVNREGYISINQGAGGLEKEIQKQLLETEGVKFDKYNVLNFHSLLYNFTK